MKKLMGLFLVIVMFLSCIPVAASGVNVYIDGKAVAFSDSTGYPFISEGRTLVPLRVTMESFGASVFFGLTLVIVFRPRFSNWE